MTQHWHVSEDSIEIAEMPFYWRLSNDRMPYPSIAQRLGIRVVADPVYDYLKFLPTIDQWEVIDTAYRQNENIGFLNPESGQIQTYGSSVNNFLLAELRRTLPRQQIVEIGCGAGFSIQFLKQHGFDVLGVDPSEYSLRWSERLGFRLVNDFFREGLLETSPDFVYCNDVFEHVRDVEKFSEMVYASLADEGKFCFATTNSTRSIALGDISMFEHQHVNMFTNRSIELILGKAGFVDINIGGGTYGNTLHVSAVKRTSIFAKTTVPLDQKEGLFCDGYFERAADRIRAFEKFYHKHHPPLCYVPLRAIPYLACVGDFGQAHIFDSNVAWRNKYIDGYHAPIEGLDDITYSTGQRFFVASLTFYDEIKTILMSKGFPEEAVKSIEDLP
jgi:2-polyprenyl-3-methyl-5-hydroxy-6-metoxy-1,4-benzoquinol methylase